MILMIFIDLTVHHCLIYTSPMYFRFLSENGVISEVYKLSATIADFSQLDRPT
jgi:hypothetical protein